MSESQKLYIWLEGDFERPPHIEVKAAPFMPLESFKQKYVDGEKTFLIMRVYGATDDEGNVFTVKLEPASSVSQTASETISGTSLTGIKGIGRRYTAMLREAGIESIEELREAGATPAQRAALSQKIGRNETILTHWVQMADLMRIEGVGEDYSALLWEAGITTPVDLPRQQPERLLDLLTRTNEEKHIAHRLPAIGQIEDWITQARKLPPLVEA